MNITIIYPYRLLADAFAISINKLPDFYVAHQIEALSELWESVEDTDLILVDSDLLKQSSFRDIVKIKKRFPQAELVVLGIVSAPEVLIARGCAGYIDLHRGFDEAIHLITRVGRGAAGGILSSSKSASVSAMDTLSLRESQTLNLIWDGMTNKEICDFLGVKQQTVSSYVNRLCEKLGVETRNGIFLLSSRLRDKTL
ncbi:helix-turn-helix transcriptional regulator [Marinobacter maroccanus]|uniref:helix-turn-helix transcriptional regulator n=1 Tax=Marinobacter maroccanus TaxID=2055143 RepID=UPI001304A67E|nr:LuxR C-terminal-related transcriptional regulator [Marinobacter maroccanus]